MKKTSQWDQALDNLLLGNLSGVAQDEAGPLLLPLRKGADPQGIKTMGKP